MEIPLCEFKFIKELGRGAFGIVHLAERKAELFAIKSLKIGSDLPEGVLTKLEHEIKIMFKLRHPNIVTLIAFSMEEQPQRYLAMEYMEGGSLRSLLSSNKPISPPTQRQFALDIARGLNYLHTLPKPVFHRDMKANNVLIDRHGTLKIADFGLSIVSSYSASAASALQPLNWCAPELAQEKPFTSACDVYSYGMTLYEILSRQLPFQGKNGQQIFIALLNNTRPEIPLNAPDDLVDLMVACWQTEPSARPTFEMVVQQLRTSIQQESNPTIEDLQQQIKNLVVKYANEETRKGIRVKSSGDRTEAIDTINQAFSSLSSSVYTGLKVHEIPRRELTKDTKLSEGMFHIIWRGTYNDVPVAIKEPKLYGDYLIPSKRLADLVEEATVMTSISNHPNVLHCYGVSRVGEDDYLLVTELCNLGSLVSFLKTYPGTPAVDRRRFSQQVARGLNHLGKHNVAHRDVAARNVLLHDQGGGVIVAKVCDFSLSRRLEEEYYVITGQHLLAPETAPEVFETRKHSSRSDVWSFGVLLWEVESFCATHAKPDITAFPPLSKPAQASYNIYAIMLKCWAKDPHQRPSFEALIDLLA